jgi:Restriction Enzyme Adenine Methylase Associated
MPELRPIDDLPLTVLIPASARRPIVMYDPQGALRLAVVEQDCAFALDDSWDSPGVYVLLWPPIDEADRQPKVYVGQAAQGLRKRIGRHVVGKSGWRRAVLVDRANAKYGFNSAQIGWLEGRLWSLTSAAEHVQPTNKVQPRDETLPDYDRPGLEAVIAVIRRVMRLLGYSLDPPGTDPKVTRKARFTVTVGDLIAAGKLTAGDVLAFTDPDFSDTATIRADGSLELRGVLHDSPSAAAAIVRGRPTNGWADWALVRVHGPITLMKLREELTELAPPPEGTPGPA